MTMVSYMQITSAVFDRMIPKFKDVLVNEELEPERTRDALKTLNEQVHHQVRHTILLLTTILLL